MSTLRDEGRPAGYRPSRAAGTATATWSPIPPFYTAIRSAGKPTRAAALPRGRRSAEWRGQCRGALPRRRPGERVLQSAEPRRRGPRKEGASLVLAVVRRDPRGLASRAASRRWFSGERRSSSKEYRKSKRPDRSAGAFVFPGAHFPGVALRRNPRSEKRVADQLPLAAPA